MVLHFLHDAIGLKDSRHLFIQSEVKPKPIVTRSHAFSRALRQPHVITSSFDWFNVLSVSYVIGQSNYFGFGFTTLKRKPLYSGVLVASKGLLLPTGIHKVAYEQARLTNCLFLAPFFSPASTARAGGSTAKGFPELAQVNPYAEHLPEAVKTPLFLLTI